MPKMLHMDSGEERIIKSIAGSMIAFYFVYLIAYKILRKKVNVSPEYEIRILTFFHGLFCSLCTAYYILLPALGYYEVQTIPYQIILSNSFGYFLLDLFWSYKHGETGIMKFHHIMTLIGLAYYSFKRTHHYYIVFTLGQAELTNPLLQIRWYLKYHEMRDTLIYKIVEVLFILAFLFLRIVLCSYYVFLAWTNDKYGFTSVDLFFITLGLLISYSLSYHIFGYIAYQFQKSETTKMDKLE